jgi:hypothetical protein
MQRVFVFQSLPGVMTALLLTACGGGGSGGGGSSTVVSFPGTSGVGIGVGATYMFAASVTGTTNTAVTYSVQEGAAGGSITAGGVYTAPLSAGTYHVAATSVADSTKSATVSVTAVPGVSIVPGSVRLLPGGTQMFITRLTGTTNTAVSFSANAGSITAAGVYTAPQTPGTYSVVATSLVGGQWVNVADNLGAATATVTVAINNLFSQTRNMVVPRVNHTATLLLDGTVLMAGGLNIENIERQEFGFPISSAELFNATSGTFAATGSMATARSGHNATLLANGALANTASYGKVLVTGGGGQTAELYNPASRLFTETGPLLVIRTGETATLLNTGEVLVVGGGTASAELYNPTSGLFTATAGSMAATRTAHTATLLQNGLVLIAGGGKATAELYDPTSGLFTATTGSMSEVRSGATATLLQDGTVLVAGPDATGERFDPTTGNFALVGPLRYKTALSTANLLGNGTVLFAGGFTSGRTNLPSNLAQLFYPISQDFTETGSLNAARYGHSGTVLADGRVLIAGGAHCSPPNPPVSPEHCWSLSSAELYE